MTNNGDSTVTPINTATNVAGTPIPVECGYLCDRHRAQRVHGLRDRRNGIGNIVTPINLATNTAGTTIQLSTTGGFTSIAITPNGATAYVTQDISNEIGNTVTPIDLATNTVEPAIAVANQPFGIAITPDGDHRVCEHRR